MVDIENDRATWRPFGEPEWTGFPAASHRDGKLPQVADFDLRIPGRWLAQRWTPDRFPMVVAILDGHGLTVLDPTRHDGRCWFLEGDGAPEAAVRIYDEITPEGLEALGLRLAEPLWLEGC